MQKLFTNRRKFASGEKHDSLLLEYADELGVYTHNMKRVLLFALAVSTVFQAKAELFSPESITGAAIGGIAGAVIGHNNGRHGGEGAAIGAGIGLLAGSIVNDNNRRNGYYSGGYSSPSYGHVSVGVGYSGHSHYPSYHHRYYGGPSFSFGYGYRPTYYARPYYAPAPVYAQPVIVQQEAAPQPAPAPAPSQVTIINNYYGSSSAMSGANAMFGR